MDQKTGPEGIDSSIRDVSKFDEQKNREQIRQWTDDLSNQYDEISESNVTSYFDRDNFTSLLKLLEQKSYQIKTKEDGTSLGSLAENIRNALVFLTGAKNDHNSNYQLIGERANSMMGFYLKKVIFWESPKFEDYSRENKISNRLRDVVNAYTIFMGKDPKQQRAYPEFLKSKK